MIPTVLIVGAIFGFIHAATHRAAVTVVGGAVAIGGWWLLLRAVGDVESTPANALGSALLVVANYAVAALAGWAVAQVLRSLFGMTTE